jgi:hypothetical protein
MRPLYDILDEGVRMKVEDEYLDVLQNMEFGIMRVFPGAARFRQHGTDLRVANGA